MHPAPLVRRSWDFNAEGETFDAVAARLARWAARAAAAWLGRRSVPEIGRAPFSECLGYRGPGDIAADVQEGERYRLGAGEAGVEIRTGILFPQGRTYEGKSYREEQERFILIREAGKGGSLFRRESGRPGPVSLWWNARLICSPRWPADLVAHVGYWHLPPVADANAMRLLREEYPPLSSVLEAKECSAGP